MNEQQVREIEKRLGRTLTPQEKRLLRYSDTTRGDGKRDDRENPRPKKRGGAQSAPDEKNRP